LAGKLEKAQKLIEVHGKDISAVQKDGGLILIVPSSAGRQILQYQVSMEEKSCDCKDYLWSGIPRKLSKEGEH